MDPEVKAGILAAIADMLDEPSCEYSISIGTQEFDEGTSWVVTRPTSGKEITIKVHGGAVDYRLAR